MTARREFNRLEQRYAKGDLLPYCPKCNSGRIQVERGTEGTTAGWHWHCHSCGMLSKLYTHWLDLEDDCDKLGIRWIPSGEETQ